MDHDQLCINTIRTLAVDAIEHANSGHPGLPLGAAPMAFVLWHRHLKVNPTSPMWADRDRFVLSAGHGSMLLYALLHLSGYDLPLSELKSFRQWGSQTPGHPEFKVCPGVEATTGPLGQGTANSVGMAIAERMLARQYDESIVDHFTYALVSDGDLMEGIAQEAASLAGHLKLGKLIWLYDSNDVSLDGPTSLAFSEDVAARHRASGWHVQTVDDGDHDLDGIDAAIAAAKAEAERPSLVVVRTTLGYGSPARAGKAAAHGAPLGAEELAATKEALGWRHEAPFTVPEEARQHFTVIGERGAAAQADWQSRFAQWAATHTEAAATWSQALGHTLTDGWDRELPSFSNNGDKIATRAAGGKVLEAVATAIPWFVGGDADLSSSTKTRFEAPFPEGRYLHFGVREHAMAAIANGIGYHGGLHPFVSTFFQFADYMRPSMRLAAMNHLPVTYVFTHDSVAVGEDGPTHQPVEHLAALRVIPNLTVVRPADANETRHAWRFAMEHTRGPVALVLTRQKLPILGETENAPVERGAYVLADNGTPRAIIIATGSEVSVALAARDLLASEGVSVRVVSMPSTTLFASQDEAYRESVLPAALRARVAVEAGVRDGWDRWVGDQGRVISIDRYGASAPGSEILERLGITAENVAAAVRETLA